MTGAKGGGKGSKALVQFESTEDSKWFVENLNGNIPEGLEAPIKVEFSTKAAGDAGKGKGKDGKGKDNGKSSYGKADAGKNGKAQASPYGFDAGKGKNGK